MVQIKGYLIRYKNSMSSTWITQRNNELFGRVVKIKRAGREIYYYYAGVLENVKYVRLSKGCYFIVADKTFLRNFAYVDDVDFIEATLNISEDSLYTAKEFFQFQYQGIEVNNLG